VEELVSRLAQTSIETHSSSTDATLHNAATFPSGHNLYVDVTHGVVVLNGQLIDELESGHLLTFDSILTALNLSHHIHTKTLHVKDSRARTIHN